MKILSFKSAMLSVVAMGLLLASCNTSIEVAKRKHRKGYHVAFNKKNEKSIIEKSVAETVEFASVDSPAVDTAKVTPAVEAPKTEALKVEEKAANESTVIAKKSESLTSNKKEKLTFVQKVKAVKQVRKQLKQLKQNRALADDDIDSDIYFILLLILALLLPPAAVYLMKGKEAAAFKLNLILWLIGLLGVGLATVGNIGIAWLAMTLAIIHAVLVLLGEV